VDLHQALTGLKFFDDPRVLVGCQTYDDAGVYRLTDDLALVQTLDFFTPIVDDPYTFGQIAMANSLSDVYAMGGTPINALSILCFPIDDLGLDVLRDILSGACDTLIEAKVALLGGHTVTDKELKYGAAVTGTVHPKRIWSNAGAKPGDVIFLTKPIGTGILTSAIKRGKLTPELTEAVTASMRRLNAAACEAVKSLRIHAATDITGYALAGHAAQLAEASKVSIRIDAKKVPLFPDMLEWVKPAFKTRGDVVNRKFIEGRYHTVPSVLGPLEDLLFDPQTSGGLFLCVDPADAGETRKRLADTGVKSEPIGEVLAQGPHLLRFE